MEWLLLLFVMVLLWSAHRRLYRLEPVSVPLLSAYLARVIERNFPMAEALRRYAQDLPLPSQRNHARDLNKWANALSEGDTLATGLQRCPWLYSPAEQALIDAAERTGQLGPLFRTLAERGQRTTDFRTSTVMQLVYPALLTCGLVYFLIFQWPMLDSIFQITVRQMGVRSGSAVLLDGFIIGLMTVLLIAVIVIAFIQLPTFLRHAAVTPIMRVMGALAWFVPVLKGYLRIRRIADYTLMLQILLANRFPADASLRIAAQAMKGSPGQPATQEIAKRVGEGMTPAEAIQLVDPNGQWTGDLAWYAGIGEMRGNPVAAYGLALVAADARMHRTANRVKAMLTPLCLLFVGCILALIMHLIFTTMADYRHFALTVP